MPKISACIISYNEEQKIRECLESLEGVADEIIVVDSESEDRTREIAYDYTDQVHLQAFLGFVEQKNLAVEKASHDWILSLDCDERLTEEARQEILDIKEHLDNCAAYSFPRKTFYVYRWLNHCWYPDRKVRLFNRKKAKWSGGDVHESVSVKGKIKKLQGDIAHYSFDSVAEHIQVLQKYTDLAAAELLKKNKRVGALSPLLHAKWTFLRVYFFNGGFKDGFAGFTAAILSFMHVYVKYAKVYTQQKREKWLQQVRLEKEKREAGESEEAQHSS